MKLRAFVIAIAAGLSVVLASCDFTHVEEASQTSVDNVLSEVDQADTPAKAEKAIRTLLRKAEVGIDWKEGAYSDFKFTDDEIDRLVAVHADYVSGKQQRHATFEEVYKGLIEADRQLSDLDHWASSRVPVDASLEEVMATFSASLRTALDNPESPESTLLLAIAGNAASMLTDSTTAGKAGTGNSHLKVATTFGLSPIQEILFAIWFGKHGHGFDSGGDSKTCPYGYNLVAKYEWQGNGWTFEKGNNVINITGNARHATWTSGSTMVDLVRIKASTLTESISVPRQTEGELDKLCGKKKNGKYGCHDMSNVLFCAFDIPDCSSICHDLAVAKYWLYRLFGYSHEAAQEKAVAFYTHCNASCHDQGSGGSYP